MTQTNNIWHVRMQLTDIFKNVSITDANSVIAVCIAGTSTLATLQDQYGNALANPLTPGASLVEFYFSASAANQNTSDVDLYGLTGGGYWFEFLGVIASGMNEINIDTSVKRMRMKIPFSYLNSTAGTEYNTGFNLPVPAMVLDRLHGCGIDVTTASSAGTATLKVGILSTQNGGNSSGFINGSVTSAAGQVIGTNGALFSTNAPYPTDTLTSSTPNGTTISYTIGSGNASAGFIYLPYVKD